MPLVSLQGKFNTTPTILITAEHHRTGLKHDAATFWIEDASASSFKICIRELQNFAGVHDEISVVSIAHAAEQLRFNLLITLSYL